MKCLLVFAFLLHLSVAQAQAEAYCLSPPLRFSVSASGGVSDVINTEARRFFNVGGTWGVTISFDVSDFRTAQLSYTGSARGVHAPGLAPGALLLQSGVLGLVRSRITNTVVYPYFVAGTGWSYWQVIADYNHSSFLRNSASSLQFPLGFGMGVGVDSFVLDLRALFSQSLSFDILTLPGGRLGLSTWSLSLGLGGSF